MEIWMKLISTEFDTSWNKRGANIETKHKQVHETTQKYIAMI